MADPAFADTISHVRDDGAQVLHLAIFGELDAEKVGIRTLHQEKTLYLTVAVKQLVLRVKDKQRIELCAKDLYEHCQLLNDQLYLLQCVLHRVGNRYAQSQMAHKLNRSLLPFYVTLLLITEGNPEAYPVRKTYDWQVVVQREKSAVQCHEAE